MKCTQPDFVIDVRDSMAPVSLLKVANQLTRMAPGQTLEVLCSDESTKSDLLDIMYNSKNRCSEVERIEDHFRLLIEKTIPEA